MGHLVGQTQFVDPQDLDGSACRVGHRTKKIEDGADADLSSRSCSVFHCPVKNRSIEKSDADLIDASLYICACEIQIHSQVLDHVRTSAYTGDSPVAVFCYLYATPRSDKRGRGGNIKSPGAVSSGPDNIQDGLILYIDFIPINVDDMIIATYFCGLCPHCPGSAGNFINRLSL